MPALEEVVFEEQVVKELTNLKTIADRLRIDYGGKEKVDPGKLAYTYDSLRRIWAGFRRYRAAPGYDLLIRKITEAQAAVSQIKAGKNIEDNFQNLLKHLSMLISLIEIRERAELTRAAA